ncbi:MAG: hypothetical protein R3335_14880, partial [Anaerolineales bacterium]|nr:hypothetical protein [Anaerolineales bacterium]
LLAEGEGDRVHLVWPYDSGQGIKLAYHQMDGAANLVSSHDIVFPGHMRTPRLVAAEAGSLHLFWASRPDGQLEWRLWHVLLDPLGNPISEPFSFLPEGEKAGKYAVTPDGQGGAVLAWDRGFESDVQVVRLGPDGRISAGPVAVTAAGEGPSLQVDSLGRAHLAWRSDLAISYALLDAAGLDIEYTIDAVDLRVHADRSSPGDVFDGPSLGYAGNWVYIFWSVTSLKDTDAGFSSTDYVAFPAGEPSSPQPLRIWTLPLEDQPYIPIETGYALTELTSPLGIKEAAEAYGRDVEYYHAIAKDWVEREGAISPHIMSPMAMTGEGDQLVVALSVTQEKRDGADTEQQIATALFSEGQYIGYSIAGETPTLSDDPVVMPDRDGDLHVVWREGSFGRRLYYATTAVAAREAQDGLTTWDIINFVSLAGMEGFSSLVLFPVMAPLWILPGLILIGLWSMRRRAGGRRGGIPWLPLLGAILFFFLTKLIFLPTILTYTPFSAWAAIPDGLEMPFRVVVPVAIFATALLVAYRLQRRYTYSMVIFYLAIVLIDSLLTLSVYGVNFMGAV